MENLEIYEDVAKRTDGDIYEMYLSTKTVEQIKAEYEN